MANSFAVCISLFCLASLSFARQVPKECAKGPEVWCENIKIASDCGAVGHCIGTVWQNENTNVTSNEVSNKIVRLFRQLKDVKDLINEEYLAARLSTACRDVPSAAVTAICKTNTARLEEYIASVLKSDTSPETMCRIIGMCNNLKLDAILNKKKPEKPAQHGVHLIGSSRCTWGPSYWCSNISTSHECGAIQHCVKRVWPKMKVPHDDDGICKICTDMVGQARQQLLSNETQEELKEVFEGSCDLIPIKLVRKECIKLSDDFVPELVETLASQMDPQTVCTVAGLCNNAHIDTMLVGFKEAAAARAKCTNCLATVRVTRNKYDATTYDDFLVALLQACGHMSSLSDSCSMLVFKYYENIRAAVAKDLTPRSVCHVSGQCAEAFYHDHALYTFHDGNMTLYEVYNDNVPCEFCEQLVKHLRDTLIANTTEIEFQKVLVGLCKQMGSFKSECLSLVEQYHSTIYYYLVSEMKPDEVCGFIGICYNTSSAQVSPLLQIGTGRHGLKPTQNKPEPSTTAAPQTNVQIVGVEAAQLPLERMLVVNPHGKEWCSFCQYFLHYVQVELSDERTEEMIRKTVENACEVLPESINSECRQFVTQYGPAVIALLVQEIDPSTICPAIGLCPAEAVPRVAINSEKSNCPLCLFAVEQLETMLKNNRSEENIRHALDNLCNHLSAKLRTECVDFVDTYTSQLVEMLVANMDAQEICVYLKLCKDNAAHVDPLQLTQQAHRRQQLDAALKSAMEPGKGDIETNEIPDHTVNGRPIKPKQKSVCIICEFVMKEIDDQIKDKHNDDEIKKLVRGVCKSMPKSVRAECDQFVEKYADLVISLLAQELDPAEVCEELKLCTPDHVQIIQQDILDCAVCEAAVMAVKKVLSRDKVDRNIIHIVEKSCNLLPAKYYDRCNTLLEIYGEGILHLIEDYSSKGVCRKIGLCADRTARVNLYKQRGRN